MTDTLEFLRQKYAFEFTPKQVDLTMGRAGLALLFAELGFTRGAEIGVERGLYAEVLCQVNPALTLFAIDPWEAYPGYREHISQGKMEAFYLEAQARLAPYEAHLVRARAVEAADGFEEESLDFVYIDGNHEFLHVAQDLHHWEKKVRLGGLVAGHDFSRRMGRGYINHVKDVVQAWVYAHGIRPLFILRGDRSASWFYVREK